MKSFFHKCAGLLINTVFTMPYSVDLYLLIADIFKTPPIYDTCWRHIDEWARELDAAVDSKIPSTKERLLVFSTDQFWISYMCALSMLFANRNIFVDIAWIHRNASVGSRPYKSFQQWQRLSKKTCNSFSHRLISLYDLSQQPPAIANEELIALAEKQAHIDVSYLLQKERINISGCAEDGAAFNIRKANNLDAILRVATFLATRQYDRIIMPSGGILEHGAVYQYAKSLGIPISTIETCDINGKMWVSNEQPVVAINTLALWRQDEPHVLSEHRKMRVKKILEDRQKPASEELVIEYQHTGLASRQHLHAQLGLRDDRPLILICPNVPFDAIFYMGGKHVFSGMWDWLVKTVDFLKDRNDCQVVIRCHPAEPHYRTEETTQKLLSEHFHALPDHIIIVPPRGAVNTYSLMEIADMGLVYASTTGLEMALRGIPVICGNPVQHYNNKDFTVDPNNIHEYYLHIERILGNPQSGRLTARQVELAWCYADLYFNKWYLPFPWHVLTLWKDLKSWPISRMVTPEGKVLYSELLDRLTGKVM